MPLRRERQCGNGTQSRVVRYEQITIFLWLQDGVLLSENGTVWIYRAVMHPRDVVGLANWAWLFKASLA